MMKNKTKIFGALAIVGCISFASAISTSAKMNGYLVKDTNTGTIYEYDSEMLIDGFLNYRITKKDAFYEDFESKFSKFGIYAYHDSTGKYVDSSVVTEAFLASREKGQTFSIITFTETKEAIASASVPKVVKQVSVNGGNIAYSDKDTGSSTSEENNQEETNNVETKSNPTLTILTKANYDDSADFSEGLAVVHNTSGLSYIDTSGKVKIGPIKDKVFRENDYQGGAHGNNYEVEYASNFHEGLAFLQPWEDSLGPQIIIDKNGKEVFQSFDVVGDYTMRDYMDGVSIASMEGVIGGAVVIVDKNGKTTELDVKKITGVDFNQTNFFGDGLLAYMSQVDYKWGYLDIKTKKVIIKHQFEDVRKFYEGIAPAALNGKWGFIDKKGNFIIKPQYEDFWVDEINYRYQVFTNGIASVMKNGKWGAIDKNGKVVVDFKYDNGFIFSNGIAAVKKDGKFGYVDMEGKEIIKPQYDDANYFNEGIALVGKGGIYYLIDKNGKKVSSETWKFENTYVSSYTPEIISYKQNGKWGLAKITN